MNIVQKVKADVSKSANDTLGNLALPILKKFGIALGNVVGLLHTAT